MRNIFWRAAARFPTFQLLDDTLVLPFLESSLGSLHPAEKKNGTFKVQPEQCRRRHIRPAAL